MIKPLLLIFLCFFQLSLNAQKKADSKSKIVKGEVKEATSVDDNTRQLGSQGKTGSENLNNSVDSPLSDFRTQITNSGEKEPLKFKDPVYFILLVDPNNELSNLCLQELKNSGRYEVSLLPKSYTYYLKAERSESQFFKKAYSPMLIVFDENDLQLYRTVYSFFDELKKELEAISANPLDLRKKPNSKDSKL